MTPQRYNGPLTNDQIAAGMSAALRNARRLIADARSLLDAGRVATAISLAALSIEESGKVSILRGMVAEKQPEKLRTLWRQYRHHRSKNGAWIIGDLAKAGARTLDAMASTVDSGAEHTAVLDAIKQIGFYTDCNGAAHWSEPDKVLNDEAFARGLLVIADILARKDEITVRELDLWESHVVGSTNARSALVRWAEAMHTEGLTKTTPEEMAEFVIPH